MPANYLPRASETGHGTHEDGAAGHRNSVVHVVSGLPRSGTSMMMQMLSAGGMPTVTDGVRGSDVDNPRGYFEDERYKTLKADSSWLASARGHAIKVVSRHLFDLPSSLEYRVVFMERELDEVLDSQEAMIQRRHGQLPKEDRITIRRIFERHLNQVYEWMARQPHILSLFVAYGKALEHPEPLANQLNEFVGGGLDLVAMRSVVEPSLRRNRSRR